MVRRGARLGVHPSALTKSEEGTLDRCGHWLIGAITIFDKAKDADPKRAGMRPTLEEGGLNAGIILDLKAVRQG